MRVASCVGWGGLGLALAFGCSVHQTQIDGKRCSQEVACPSAYVCVRAEGSTEGLCRPEATACAAAGVAHPSPELCDGVDNDCNGIRDDAPGCLTTEIGTAPPGLADGAAPDARFGGPAYLTADGQGGYYVADELAHAVRRVDAQGAVTTLAGDGRCGFADGPVASARFCHPIEVAVQGDVLFVSDFGNNRIRRIAEGAVTTVAGTGVRGALDGPALEAELDGPSGLQLLANGDLLIADTRNHALRRLSPSSGQLSTYAGSPGVDGDSDGPLTDALFNHPRDIAQSSSGVLYVTDDHRVRKIESGTVSTLAGSGGGTFADGSGDVARFYAPGQIALDEVDGIAVVTDTVNNRIRAVELATGTTSTLSGIWRGGYWNDATPGHRAPLGVLTLAPHTYLVADQANQRLRKLVLQGADYVAQDFSGGTVREQVRDGRALDQARLSDPGSLVRMADGTWAWAETDLNIVRIATPSGDVRTVGGDAKAFGSGYENGAGIDARFYGPVGVVPVGRSLWVSDTSNQAIRAIDLDTGLVSTVAGSPSQPSETGDADGAFETARFNYPDAMAVGQSPSGQTLVYVWDSRNATIRTLEVAARQVATLAGTSGTSGVNDGPPGTGTLLEAYVLTADDQGHLWVIDDWNRAMLRRIDPDGRITTLTPDLGIAVTALAYDGPGKLLAAATSELYEIDLSQVKATLLFPDALNPSPIGWQDGDAKTGALWEVSSLLPRPDGVWLLDHLSRRIRRLERTR